MLLSCASRRQLATWIVALLIGAALQRAHVLALPPADDTTALPERGVTSSSVPPANEPIPEIFTRATAIAWALQNNPELAAFRQQHGIAAAAVIVAKTYPFNPLWTSKLFATNGREGAGITNRVAMEQRISIDLEVRGQGRYRRQAACAALSRTDWEIANQETVLAVRVVRAFDSVVYQHAKLRLAEEGLHLQEVTAEQVRRLFDAGKLHSPDLMLARSEIDSFSIALDAARSAQAKAEFDLRAVLGFTSEVFKVEGTLDPTPVSDDAQPLLLAALEQRPDLRARQAAVREAEGRRRLAVADRFGNLNVGPDYEYNETSVNFLGTQFSVPLPLLNTHRGEILQRQAELTRAALDLRTAEVVVQQQVHAALSRLSRARTLVATYQTRVLPNLETSLKDMETLFNQSAVDLLKVIDVQRKLLTARSGYLDALYELRQARDDLAAAAADLALAIDPGSSVPAQ
jgi:outer membrane protein, heavy metal efflux system